MAHTDRQTDLRRTLRLKDWFGLIQWKWPSKYIFGDTSFIFLRHLLGIFGFCGTSSTHFTIYNIKIYVILLHANVNFHYCSDIPCIKSHLIQRFAFSIHIRGIYLFSYLKYKMFKFRKMLFYSGYIFFKETFI